MAALLVLLCFLATLVSATVDVTKITAEPGENATLPCRTPNNRPAIVVEWIRNETGEVKHVALYRGDRFDLDGQDSLYRNRVDLLDREMKNGDISLVLKNVTTDHTGTYECRVYQEGNKRRKRDEIKGDPICIISLDVAPPPPSGDMRGLQEDGGNKDRGSEDGGNKDRGNEDGGNKDGGNEDGGSKCLQDYVGKEEDFSDQQLYQQERNSSLVKEEPEALQIKEENQKPEHPWTKEETMELPIDGRAMTRICNL
ncbi:PREDICTED: uncharacterized protein LOC107101496 [Cyprinodon variegatus]|uniref:uncharacterized protein LOC107101496 n=1 Tax=Cyprinodon variegatus TaxID=28743 RepID=UPI0007425A4C|nr:PREDICTED: uncharacterized protein LOC107101496 [Cyprinodon variegatus]